MEKKGDISLTTIVVAAIALIVLVVLVMIFTGRMGIFKGGVEKAGETELVAMKISYDDCHPSESLEVTFTGDMGRAASEAEKDQVKNTFRGEIDRCGAIGEAETCRGTSGCGWK